MKRPASTLACLGTFTWIILLCVWSACERRPHNPAPGCDSLNPSIQVHLDSAQYYRKVVKDALAASERYRQVLEELERCPNDSLKATAAFSLGIIQSETLSMNNSALGYFRIALKAAGQLKEPYVRDSMASKTMLTMANMHMMLGYQDSGRFYADSALVLARRIYEPSDVRITRAMGALAYAHFNIGNLEKADSIRYQLLNIRLRKPSHPKQNNHGIAYTNYAEGQLHLNHLDRAEHYLKLAFAAFAKMEDQAGNVAQALDLGTQIALQRQDYPLALERVAQALALAKKNYDSPHREIGKILCRAGDVQMVMAQFDSALVLYHAALREFCPHFLDTDLDSLPRGFEFTSEPWVVVALSGKAHAWEAKGDIAKSTAAYRCAFACSDRFRRGFSAASDQLVLTRTIIPEFERAIRMSSSVDSSSAAFEWIERSKANAQLDALTGVSIAHPELWPDTLLLRGRRLRDSLELAQQQAAAGLPGAPERVGKWEASLGDFKAKLQEDYPGLLPNENKSNHQFTTIQEMQDPSVLPDSALFISYFVGDSSVYISAFNAWDETFIEIKGLADLKAEITRLLDLLQKNNLAGDSGERSRQVYAQCSYRIYQMLVEPVLLIHQRVKSKIRRLIIAPDAELSFIPFAALLDANPSPVPTSWKELPYMIKHWDITYINSATHLRELKKQQTKRASGALPGIFGLGTNTANPDKELENAEQEVSTAVEIMGGTELLQQAASESALKTKRSSREILHVASHGVVNDAAPLDSYVLLHGDSLEDGLLHAYEVFKLDLSERMTILNACQTGRGQPVRGQGVLSIGYAFQVAKCPIVVMSLWNIDDAATPKVFTQFYNQLAKGKTASEALNLGTREYLADSNGDDFKHPSKWAPFVMVGDGEQVFAALPRPWWMSLLWFVWVPPLLLLLWLRWRRRRYDF